VNNFVRIPSMTEPAPVLQQTFVSFVLQYESLPPRAETRAAEEFAADV